jgi:hypothetical protein
LRFKYFRDFYEPYKTNYLVKSCNAGNSKAAVDLAHSLAYLILRFDEQFKGKDADEIKEEPAFDVSTCNIFVSFHAYKILLVIIAREKCQHYVNEKRDVDNVTDHS